MTDLKQFLMTTSDRRVPQAPLIEEELKLGALAHLAEVRSLRERTESLATGSQLYIEFLGRC